MSSQVVGTGGAVSTDYCTESLLDQVHKLTRAQKRQKRVVFSDDEVSDADNTATVNEAAPKVAKVTTSDVTVLGVRGIGIRWLAVGDDTYLTFAKWARDVNGEWIQVPGWKGKAAKV